MLKNGRTIILFSILFSLLQSIGLHLYYYNSFSVRGESYLWMKFVGIFICSNILICCFLYALRCCLTKIVVTYSDGEKTKKVRDDKRACIISFFVISLGWIPWIIAYYPGSLFYDMAYQLEQYYGNMQLHLHPPFSTLIVGKCMDLGRVLFGSDNRGLFIYTMLQFLVCAGACAVSIKELLRMRIPRWIVYIAIIFYSNFPLFGATVQCVMKDNINYGLMLLACVMIMRLYNNISEMQTFELTNVVKLAIISLLSCLFRKEMVYIFFFVVVALGTYAYIKEKKIRNIFILIPILLAVLLSGTVTNKIIAKGYFGQEFEGGDSESLSIPLQFVARIVKYHDDILSDEEKNTIGECFYYGYENISHNYNPYMSDPIKYNFNTERAKENGFWNIFRKLLRKKTDVFFESICVGGYGYFSIVPNVPCTVDDAPTNGLPGSRIPPLYINLDIDEQYGNFSISFHDSTSEFRNFMENYIRAFQLPYNILYSFGFYTWIILLMLFMVIKKGNIFSAIPFVLVLFLITVCIMSPVNDHGRYYMGIIFAIPLLVGYSLDVWINEMRERTKSNMAGFMSGRIEGE